MSLSSFINENSQKSHKHSAKENTQSISESGCREGSDENHIHKKNKSQKILYCASAPGEEIEQTNINISNTSNINNGRWSNAEHKAFINGIFKFSNDWKRITGEIKTRTCLQARSHSQKFFSKLNKYITKTNTNYSVDLKKVLLFSKQTESVIALKVIETLYLAHDHLDNMLSCDLCNDNLLYDFLRNVKKTNKPVLMQAEQEQEEVVCARNSQKINSNFVMNQGNLSNCNVYENFKNVHHIPIKDTNSNNSSNNINKMNNRSESNNFACSLNHQKNNLNDNNHENKIIDNNDNNIYNFGDYNNNQIIKNIRTCFNNPKITHNAHNGDFSEIIHNNFGNKSENIRVISNAAGNKSICSNNSTIMNSSNTNNMNTNYMNINNGEFCNLWRNNVYNNFNININVTNNGNAFDINNLALNNNNINNDISKNNFNKGSNKTEPQQKNLYISEIKPINNNVNNYNKKSNISNLNLTTIKDDSTEDIKTRSRNRKEKENAEEKESSKTIFFIFILLITFETPQSLDLLFAYLLIKNYQNYQ